MSVAFLLIFSGAVILIKANTLYTYNPDRLALVLSARLTKKAVSSAFCDGAALLKNGGSVCCQVP